MAIGPVRPTRGITTTPRTARTTDPQIQRGGAGGQMQTARGGMKTRPKPTEMSKAQGTVTGAMPKRKPSTTALAAQSETRGQAVPGGGLNKRAARPLVQQPAPPRPVMRGGMQAAPAAPQRPAPMASPGGIAPSAPKTRTSGPTTLGSPPTRIR